MRVFVTPLTPKLTHYSAQNIEFTAAAVDAAASVLYCRLRCSSAVTCRPQVLSIKQQLPVVLSLKSSNGKTKAIA